MYATRIAWTLLKGEIGDGLFICHHCDNSRCVNIEHLFVGSAKDNTADRIKKGRVCGPPKWHEASLDIFQRTLFKADALEGMWNKDLAEKYGLSATQVTKYRQKMGLPPAYETRKKR